MEHVARADNSPMESAIDRVNYAIEQASHRLDVLEKNISAVLGPENPMPVSPNVAMDERPMSSLQSLLLRFELQIMAHAERIERLTARCEL